MAVAEQVRVDPTAGIIQSILNMGGTKEKTSSSTSVDPGALANLQAILNQQMGSTTPEGSANLLRAIFQGGLEQVPGLATTYGQAAGARSSNNSPLQIAMQDMMLKLTNEGAKQVSANQVNAANTAGTIANATKTTNTTGTKAPKLSALQLAPFLLGAASKFKGGIPGFDQAVSQFDNFITGGSPLPAPVVDAGFGGSAGINMGALAGQSADVFGFDFGAPTSAALSTATDFGFGGSDAMGFDFGSSVASDVGASSLFDTAGTEFLEGGFLGFEKGGLVGRDGKVPHTGKPRHYASGGYISASDTSNLRDTSGQAIRGSTINDSITDVIPRILAGAGGSGSISRPSSRTTASIPLDKKLPISEAMESAGESSVGSGIATGQVATPEEAAAAALGFAITMGAVPLGVPAALGIGLSNMMGHPATPISPISPLVSAITGFISNAIGGPGSQGDPNASNEAAPEGVSGMSVGPVGVGNGISTTGQSIGIGMGGFGGFGGIGDSSVGDSGDSGSVGDAASAGVGGGGFSKGGDVSGPKGKDKIPAYLSDGEYVINKNTVAAFGIDFFDAINSMFAGAKRG